MTVPLPTASEPEALPPMLMPKLCVLAWLASCRTPPAIVSVATSPALIPTSRKAPSLRIVLPLPIVSAPGAPTAVILFNPMLMWSVAARVVPGASDHVPA